MLMCVLTVNTTLELLFGLYMLQKTYQHKMVRVYKKKIGSRNYCNYTPQTLETCLNAVRSGIVSQRKAARMYSIPIATLKNKLKKKHVKTVGGQKVFSDNEEKSFVQHLIKLSEFGFPVIAEDFRQMVRHYLNKKGVNISQFKDNLPGSDWLKRFFRDHPDISVRVAQNVKRVRAGVSHETLRTYMEHLEQEINGVPPSNIWNYDESNLTDNPGNKKAICRRGMKYPDRICNFSKTSTSVMFCGSAEGKFLPPYIVFKAEHMWSSWIENGPNGARYNRSKSGWFDSAIFEDWFHSLFLPAVRHLQGPIVLIGDNLASHISVAVLKTCEEKNIKFICLPPNSTHIAQPLDVAVFAPMKRVWRKILSEWRETSEGHKYPTIPKEKLPVLLKKLMLHMQVNISTNLQAGFEKCGICPPNKQKLLDRLPNPEIIEKELVGNAFIESLQSQRMDVIGDAPRQRRKKISVTPGRSISLDDVQPSVSSPLDVQPSVSSPLDDVQPSVSSPPQPSTVKSRRSKRFISEESSDESQDDPDTFSDTTSSEDESASSTTQEMDTSLPQMKDICTLNDFVIVLYNGNKYPGKITHVDNEGPTVSCLEKGKTSWHWPQRKDEMQYSWDSVLEKITPPKQISSKRMNMFLVPQLDMFQ